MTHNVSYSRVPLLVAATACWGTGTVVTKQVLGSLEPLTLLPLQLAASCVFLLAAVGISNTRVDWSPQMTRLTLLGILNPGGPTRSDCSAWLPSPRACRC